ncbi:MAG: DUF3341 domain-containing protein [Bacteroidetes bacterium]|nr:DUF3341 domain-containing protein [Bacteroidota bacterium]MCY4204494.1 DUF3341 domain-containing protein [Bacteroidota bacterium]
MLKKVVQNVKASMGIYQAREDMVYGLLAEYPNPGALVSAARKVHSSGYRHFDTHSPFPIHGMDRAMGLGQSKVGYLTLIGGISGLALATWLQWWTSAVDYPMNISGKPFFAIEPSIPIMFELTVLLAALVTVGGMLAMNGLPRPYNPLFYSRGFSRVTDDAFFLHIAASDSNFDLDETETLLKEAGATSIEVVHDHGYSEVYTL